MYRHFGRYLEQRQGSDPFQTFVAAHDICADTTKDPAWHNPTLQRCLPEAKTTIGEEGQVQLRGRTYRAYGEDLPLPSPRTPVAVRLASLSRQYGWVWVKDRPYTRVHQTKAPEEGKYS